MTDIYKFNLTTGGAFNVSLSGLTDNADVFLLSSNNQILQTSALSGNLSETLSFQNLSAGIYSLQITSTAGATDYLLGIQTQETSTNVIDPLTGLPLTDNQLPTHPNFETGIFRVGETGIVNIDYLYDGGRFAGDFGLVNLAGMEAFTPGSTNYIKEAARRALTNSSLGYTVISDATEAAKFSGIFTPTETDFNTGTYQGIKTFAMKPGDTFGFILAPQDSLQTIFNNPALVGGRRPLFSMGTANPNDTFYPGQLTRITNNNTGFVFEDTPVLSPGGSTDYNDLIFQIQGTTNIAPSLTDYVYGGRDWRNTSNGQQIVTFINTADTIAPTIQAALANDTGENNTDKITFDPTISGLVTDSSKIFSLRARFNNTPIGSFTDIVSLINSDGTFSLNRQQLETIYGQALPEGEHTLHLQAIDKYGAVSNTFTLAFTLEPEVIPVTDIGGIYQFNGQVINGTLRPRQSQQFTFNLRDSEINSTASDTVLISMSVAAISGSNFQPGVPALQGLTPLVSQNNTNNSYALFAFNTAGQNTINLTGLNSTTNGQYGLQLTVAGDINLDEKVDATDVQLLNQALGITSNNQSYSLNLDINRDGVINNNDVELLNQNLGFVANTPAVITPSNILTHQELETTIDLDKFVSDADNDALTYSINNPVNGTLETLNDGQTVVFKPASNFAGVGSFEISVDDGYYRASETININVSDAPLINLEIIKSKKQLNVGETISLEVQGDFADEENVVLPDSYLTYATENAEIAQISASGDVTASSEGTTVLSVKRNNISAVTAIRAGEIPIPKNDSEFNQALAEMNGLDAYPDAVTLTVGGKRQLLVGVNDVVETPDLKTASSGTRYFVSDSNILSVTADGEVTGLKEGFATVTIINGVADEVVPIRVQIPQNNQTIINANGGAVRSDDGAMVMVAPGSLNEDTPVSIQQLSEQQLSLAVPDNFSFAGAFQLELGSEPLDVPVQLAIPAPQNVAAGTEVFFMRKVSLPDETGTMKTMWLVEESGIVGNDGMIRTSSPPWQGVCQSGEYILTVPKFSYNVAKAIIRPDFVDAANVAGFAISSMGVLIGFNIIKIGFLSNPLIGAVAVGSTLLGGLLLAVARQEDSTEITSSVNILTIPKIGLPYTTTTNVSLNLAALDSGKQPTIALDIPSISVPPTQPLVEKVELKFTSEYGRVISVEGKNFGTNTNSDKLSVNFQHGGKQYLGKITNFTPIDEERTRIEIVSDFVPLNGDESEIIITRKLTSLIGTETEEQTKAIKIPVDGCVELALVPSPQSDTVNVINALNSRQVTESSQFGSRDLLLAQIPVGTLPQLEEPRYVAVTNNSARAYVPLQQSGKVAVVDVTGLKQLDTNPNNEGINPIELPTGAAPFSIVIDYQDQYAYVSERNNGAIYVLDINPFSSNYNKCIGTIVLNNAVNGIGQMAISGDGKRLFVTTPTGSPTGRGQIIVINIDPNDRPRGNVTNERNWHKEIGRIEAGLGLEGISATPDPLKMAFTNRREEPRGYGVLTITNNDPKSFAATVNYAGMNLGFATDYFDVNEAVAVTVMRDALTGKDYAFVAGRNGRLLGSGIESIDGVRAGSNIGIIEDALGSNPRLVAATRPIPNGLTSGLGISSDGRYLTAAYPGIQSSLMFDIKEILKTVQNPTGDLTATPIDDLNPAISIAADFKDIGNPLDSLLNKVPFGVPAFSNTPPLTTGGSPFSVAMASVRNPVNLLPIDVSGDPLKPRFTWNFEGKKEGELPEAGMCIDPLKDEEIEEVNLYVSVFDKDNGLLPERWTPTDGIEGVDYNPNRVLTARWKGGVWSWNGGSKEGSKYEFSLPDDRMLTAGQTYHWAVKVKLKNQPATYIFEDEEYNVPLPESTNPNTFSSVTVLSRGLEPGNTENSQLINGKLKTIVDHIQKLGGNVLEYKRSIGRWQPVSYNGNSSTPTTNLNYGKPLVLLADWLQGIDPSNLYNGGFAEAAADSLFAGLVQLDQQHGGSVGMDGRLYDENGNLIRTQGAIFNSPLHFIGFGQGAVVNTEIVQRLGTFFPNAGGFYPFQRDLQMTTIDPHDYDDVNSPAGVFRNIYDPEIKVWDNVTYADNYYQLTGSNDMLKGEEILSADWNVDLSNRAGLDQDIETGGPHRSSLSWYAGTNNLNQNEDVYRRKGDLTDNQLPSYTPDHTNANFNHGDDNASWEGIGSGWFYSVLAGGKNKRPYNIEGYKFSKDEIQEFSYPRDGWKDYLEDKRISVNQDNTPIPAMRGDFSVPTIFNGNFDAIVYQYSSQNIPSWYIDRPNNPLKQSALIDVKDIPGSTPYSNAAPNYALQLGGSNPTQATRDWFVIPEWGNLRFDVFAPVQSGELNVKLETIDGQSKNITINLAQDANFLIDEQNRSDIPFIKDIYSGIQNQIGFGRKGFETFQLNLQLNDSEMANFRGKPARLIFSLQGGDFVYIDNVFFKSDFLKFGNPTEARWNPSNNSYQNNLLLEKPQYAVSYNADTKIPNWVGWKVDRTWVTEPQRQPGELPEGLIQRPEFITDPDLLATGLFTYDGNIFTRLGMDRGHLSPDRDRVRHPKDQLATYLTTNLIAQSMDNNRFFVPRSNSPADASAWFNIEDKVIPSRVAQGQELYIFAGAIGNNVEPQKKTNVPDLLNQIVNGEYINWGNTNPSTFRDREIHIPRWTWKTIMAVEQPGTEVTSSNIETFAYMTPNIAEPDWNNVSSDGVVNPLNNNMFSPFLDSARSNIANATAWRNPETWRVTLPELTKILNERNRYRNYVFNFDFLSNLP